MANWYHPTASIRCQREQHERPHPSSSTPRHTNVDRSPGDRCAADFRLTARGESLSAAPKLRTVEMKRGDLRVFIAATGTVEPNEVVEVGALVSGPVVSFANGSSNTTNADISRSADATQPMRAPVRVGTHVVQGGVLAQIDPRRIPACARSSPLGGAFSRCRNPTVANSITAGRTRVTASGASARHEFGEPV